MGVHSVSNVPDSASGLLVIRVSIEAVPTDCPYSQSDTLDMFWVELSAASIDAARIGQSGGIHDTKMLGLVIAHDVFV